MGWGGLMEEEAGDFWFLILLLPSTCCIYPCHSLSISSCTSPSSRSRDTKGGGGWTEESARAFDWNERASFVLNLRPCFFSSAGKKQCHQIAARIWLASSSGTTHSDGKKARSCRRKGRSGKGARRLREHWARQILGECQGQRTSKPYSQH
jgi:hypothetical protein